MVAIIISCAVVWFNYIRNSESIIEGIYYNEILKNAFQQHIQSEHSMLLTTVCLTFFVVHFFSLKQKQE